MEGQADNNESQAVGGKAADKQGTFFPSTDPCPAPAQPGEDMHRGWFKIWRKWRDHELAQDPNGWLVFTHILCEVRRQAKYNRVAGITVEPGECDLTQQQLSEATKLSRKAIRAALSRLERYETIKTRPSKGQRQGHKRNVITVLNWRLYNGAQDGEGQSPDGNGAPSGPTKVPSPKKGEKGKKEEKTTLPADKPPKPRKPHWSEPAGSRLAKLTGCPQSGPWSFLSKLAREQTESAVLDALARFPWDRALNWKHATGWITEAAKSIHSTAPAPDDYEDRLD